MTSLAYSGEPASYGNDKARQKQEENLEKYMSPNLQRIAEDASGEHSNTFQQAEF